MTVRLPLVVSAVFLSSVGLMSSAYADPPPNGQHHGGNGAPPNAQHGAAPGAAPAANNNMAAHGNAPPNNNAPNQNHGAPGGGPGIDIHAGVNVGIGGGIGGGPIGGRPVVRGAPIVYDDRMRHDEDVRLAQIDAARRNAALWDAQRYQREIDHRRALESRWGADFYYRPECRYEIALDANRTARLERIIYVAEDNHDLALAARARSVLARENARHAREMIALRIRLGYQ